MQHSFDHEDPNILWVNADAPDVGCTGAYENPFSTIETALDRVHPGQTIVLMNGEYVGDCNIQRSGTIHKPIRIFAEDAGGVTINRACWFFYDTSDLIVSGFTFTNTPAGAISLIGNCNRNRFDTLSFLDCGNRGDTACTLYIGGAGGGCNIVEACTFELTAPSPTTEKASVAIMLAHGDHENSNLIQNNVIRRNRFSHYDYGIIAGSDGAQTSRCGNVIEYNTISECIKEGILVKTGDTIVRSNNISGCTGHALTIQSDLDCSVEANRISNCATGIQVFGQGHTITSNCLVACTDGAVFLRGETDAETSPALNCFVEHNTFVNCSGASNGSAPVAGIIIDIGTTGIFQHNLVSGSGKPYAIHDIQAASGEQPLPPTHFIIKDNRVMDGCDVLDGTSTTDTPFANAADGDYTSAETAGANGWVVKPEGFDPEPEETCANVTTDTDALLTEDNSEHPDEPATKNLFGDFYDEGIEEEQPESEEEDELRYWYPDSD